MPHKHKPLGRHFGLLLLLLSVLLTGCNQSSDEEQLAQAIDAIVTGIEEKDSSQVLDQLSDQFQTRHGHDKQWAQKLLALNFLRHGSIGVTLVQQQTRIDPLYPDRAQSSGQVLLTGSDRWLPKEGRLLQVEAKWRKDGDQWHLYQLQWE